MPWWPPSLVVAGADEEVGADAVRDEGLGAVDDVAAVARSAEVEMPATSEPAPGSVIPSAPIFSPATRDEPALLLPFGAEVDDRRHRDRAVGVESHGGADAIAGAPISSAETARGGTAAVAAVLFGKPEAVHAGFGARL